MSSMENVKNATMDMIVVNIHSHMAHFLFRPAQMDMVSRGGFVQYEINTIDPSTAKDIAYGNISSIERLLALAFNMANTTVGPPHSLGPALFLACRLAFHPFCACFYSF